jgi:hypothetical protein
MITVGFLLSIFTPSNHANELPGSPSLEFPSSKTTEKGTELRHIRIGFVA